MSCIKADVDIRKALEDIEKERSGSKLAVKDTIRDMKRRGPGVVADEVRKVYAVKKGQVMPKSTSVTSEGDSLESFKLVYKGEHLNPTAQMFHLTPAARPQGNYTLRMTVKRGRREVIGRYKAKRTRGGPYSQSTGALLMGGKAKQRMEPRHTGYRRYFTTTSVPQMVSNTEDGVKDRIETKLGEMAEERLEHNLERYT